MDINGAKALKRRLGPSGEHEARPPAEGAEVPADAPPIYHWTGKTPPETPSAEAEETASRSSALFRQLRPSVR